MIKQSTIVIVNVTTLTVRKWAERTGISMGLISLRVHMGWSLEKAVTTKRLTRQQAGIRAANKMRFVLPCVGKVSPEYIPGKRKPRADRNACQRRQHS